MQMFQLIVHTIHLNDNLKHYYKIHEFLKIQFGIALTSITLVKNLFDFVKAS